MNLKRTKAVAKKEFYHLVRDYRMLSILLFFPVFLLIIFGYAVNFDVKDIKLSIYDNDRSILSRRFINSITSSGYFVIESYLTNSDDIDNTISLKKAQSVLFIPKDFS
ncbi:MAG TPA: ABC transporter permease, partial [Ignavibacteriaceae bacterium]|nr:ABC transporter permease [Ignavibacteriaceae bacterium]